MSLECFVVPCPPTANLMIYYTPNISTLVVCAHLPRHRIRENYTIIISVTFKVLQLSSW